MILTITMNPAIDIRYSIDEFNLNSTFRSEPNKTPGGKGINVARVASILGANVFATGVLGGESGRWIRSNLGSIGDEFIEVLGDTRECLAIIGSNSQTEILGLGPYLSNDEEEKFLDHLSNIISKYNVVCISGSLPRGLEPSFYSRILDITKGKKTILDTSKEALMLALKSNPTIVKPNLDELRAISKGVIKTPEDIIEAAKQLIVLGAKSVLVSLGGDGAIFIGDDTYKLSIPNIELVNPVGSGDASVAGLAYGIMKDYSLEETLKTSMACGLSNAMTSDTGNINIDDIDRLKKLVDIIRVQA